MIALNAALNYQKMKFEELQKNYNNNINKKIQPNEKKSYSNLGGNNSKLIVPEWSVKFKGNTKTVDGNKWD